MEYRIAQSQKYLGNDYWQWSAWIDASPEDLQAIERVTWILHPSFNKSRLDITNAATGFRLEAKGWGGFRLRAQLHERGGKTRDLSKMLDLTYPDEDSDPAAAKRTSPGDEHVASTSPAPYIFLSYASEDATQAGAVRAALKTLGVNVRDAAEIEPDLPFDAAVRKLIRESAGVVTVVGGSYASPFVIAEAKLAEAEAKPAVTLLPKGVTRPPGLTSEGLEVRFGEGPGELEQPLTSLVNNLRARGIV